MHVLNKDYISLLWIAISRLKGEVTRISIAHDLKHHCEKLLDQHKLHDNGASALMTRCNKMLDTINRATVEAIELLRSNGLD
jgi:hypothetical protein